MLAAILAVALSSPLSPGGLRVALEPPAGIQLAPSAGRLLAEANAVARPEAPPRADAPRMRLRGPIIMAAGVPAFLAGLLAYRYEYRGTCTPPDHGDMGTRCDFYSSLMPTLHAAGIVLMVAAVIAEWVGWSFFDTDWRASHPDTDLTESGPVRSPSP